MKKKRVTAWDLIPQEEKAIEAIDRDGYELLGNCGYAVEMPAGEQEVAERQRSCRLAAEMKRRGHRLSLCAATDAGKGGLLFWFELRQGNVLIRKSRGVQFIKKEQ